MSGAFFGSPARSARFMRLVVAGPPALALAALPLYALLVLHPLALENEQMRVQAAGLAVLSEQVFELEEKLAGLRREFDEETPSYRGMLQDLRGWRVEAHTYVSRIAADAGLEVAAMEWTEAEPASPEFEADKRRRWLRTGVFIKLVGAWRAHRDFARKLSHCDCLVQVLEKKVTAPGRAGEVEASMSLVIYHPRRGVDV